MGSVKVALSQMVDLALGTPEVGAVNFNVVHTILQTIVLKTGLSNLIVEHKGDVPGFQEGAPTETGQAADDKSIPQFNELKAEVAELSERVTHLESTAGTTSMQDLQENMAVIEDLKSKFAEMSLEFNKTENDPGRNTSFGVSETIMKLERDLAVQNSNLAELQSQMIERINDLSKHLDLIEKDLGIINEKVNVQSQSFLGASATTLQDSPGESRAGGSQVLTSEKDVGHLVADLFSKVNSIQQDLEQMLQTFSLLAEDKENLEMRFYSMKEELEVLKTVKADKMEMEDVLAGKADVTQVIRKVSQIDFQNKVDGVDENINNAFNKLHEHELEWHAEKENIYKEIDNKMDKSDILPIKDYLTESIKILMEKVKALAAMRNIDEAAGAKRKIIKDLNCISCDKDVIMNQQIESSDVKQPDGMKAHPSVKPFLTYKLDQVRKQQQKLPPGKNLLHFEEMMHNADPRNKKLLSLAPVVVQVDSALHICNRYCGGGHTITTPLQRVTRTGHFLTEFGIPPDTPKAPVSPRNPDTTDGIPTAPVSPAPDKLAPNPSPVVSSVTVKSQQDQ